MEKDTMIFQLSSTLQYSKKGDFVDTATLEFKAPSMNEYDDASDFAQYIMGAIMEQQKNTTPEEMEVAMSATAQNDSELDPEGLRIVLMAAKNVRFREIAATFKKLSLKVGTCDGETKLTDDLISKMTPADWTRCVCEYAVNFITPSLF